MKKSSWILLVVIALIVGCGSDEVLGETVTPEPSPTVEVTPTAASTLQISDLFNGDGARDVTVGGAVVWDERAARLCAALMESFPPQCGDPSVTIANPEMLTLTLEEAGAVRWTQGFVELTGWFDGEQLVLPTIDGVDPDDAQAEPTLADEALADAFLGFVAEPSAERLAHLSLSETVALGLGDEIVFTRQADTLIDPQNWTIERDEFRAWSGPFSVLWFAEEPVAITIGSHPRCAADPVPAPFGFAGYRRVSLQPTTATSCLEWWTIDFFVDGAGDVGAITLDLFAP